ncbi:MAG: amidohydrolase family protein [Woeseiaceae bacterium]|nr:amidohydrolase family protein [Woeseiaceae bacterium]
MKYRSLIAIMLLVGLVACQPDTELVAPATAAIDKESPLARTTTIVHCGILIDGISGEPKFDQTIMIVDGRIGTLTNERALIGDIDLSDYTCLPGLIDTHAHMVEGTDTADLSVYLTRTSEEQQGIATELAWKTLAAGFTTVRNLAAYDGFADVVLRDRIDSGEIPGPRMQVSGFYLTIPGGGGDLLIPGYTEDEIPERLRMGVSRGPEEFRRNALKGISGGATVLKVIASGAVLAYGGVPGSPEMTPEEIAAVVEVGHAADIKVTAHAHGAESIKNAILAGADSIEHASLADDEAIALALEHDVAFSMDIYNGTYIASVGLEEGWPEEFLRKNDETTEAQRQVFSKAVAAGVPIIYGTDSGVYPHGDNGKMFAIQVRRGMTPMQSIQSATSVAAKYMGWERDVGAIVPGRYGDIVAVRGNPLEDISRLENVEVVIKGGVRYK